MRRSRGVVVSAIHSGKVVVVCSHFPTLLSSVFGVTYVSLLRVQRVDVCLSLFVVFVSLCTDSSFIHASFSLPRLIRYILWLLSSWLTARQSTQSFLIHFIALFLLASECSLHRSSFPSLRLFSPSVMSAVISAMVWFVLLVLWSTPSSSQIIRIFFSLCFCVCLLFFCMSCAL